MENKGYIYILTNPSFPDYVKIGYADNVEQRLAELNRTPCTPFAFRVYATYQVNSRLTDMKIHDMIDKLNPSLRSIDQVNGKKRVREFFAMVAEDAYSIFEAIAEITGTQDSLKLWKQTEAQKAEEETAKEIENEKQERLSPFNFSKCKIEIGSEIVFYCKGNDYDGTVCVVVDEKHIKYDNKEWSLSSLAQFFTNRKNAVAGPRYFKYKDEWLNDIRKRLEV